MRLFVALELPEAARAELTRFLDAVPPEVLVVLDEAYREFVTDGDVPDGFEIFGDRPNVVVLRTLSKAWGLAGLRVGYLVATPTVAAEVARRAPGARVLVQVNVTGAEQQGGCPPERSDEAFESMLTFIEAGLRGG